MKRILLLPILAFVFQVGFAQNPVQLRVLTFNVMHGATMKQDFDLNKISAIINRLQPDLVALQELDLNTGRSSKHYYDLAAELGYRTRMSALFGKAIGFDGGYYGIGILSKMPFVAAKNTALPMKIPTEVRTMLQSQLVLNSGDTLRFICTHLDAEDDDTNRLLQADKILETIKGSKYPVILAGDMNDTPVSAVIRKFDAVLKNTESPETTTYTYPSSKPDRKIDYIFLYPRDKWKVISSQAINDPDASDHLAYFSVVEMVDKDFLLRNNK